jgi:hypothetical protein
VSRSVRQVAPRTTQHPDAAHRVLSGESIDLVAAGLEVALMGSIAIW